MSDPAKRTDWQMLTPVEVASGIPIRCALDVPEPVEALARYSISMILLPLGLSPQWCDKSRDDILLIYRSGESTAPARVVISMHPSVPAVFINRSVSIADLLVQSRFEGGTPVLFPDDPVAEAFFWLSDWQSTLVTPRDRYGRLQYADSFQRKLDVFPIPLADIARNKVSRALEATGVTFSRRTWHGKKSAFCLTHDIDHPVKWTGRRLFYDFRQRQVSRVKRKRVVQPGVRRVIEPADVYTDGIVYLLTLAKQFEVAPTWFVKTGGGATEDDWYPLGSGFFGRFFDEVNEAGGEIGLHPAFFSSNNPARLREEVMALVSIIGRPVRAVRSHYLRFDGVRTLSAFEHAGFAVDSTLAFPDRGGFRNGTVFPFLLFDTQETKVSRVWEFPPAVHDTVLIRSNDLDRTDPVEEVNYWSEWVERQGGCLTMLWHNGLLDEVEYGGWAEVFERSLAEVLDADPCRKSMTASLIDWLS